MPFGRQPLDEEWEGRVFGSVVHDEAYPLSRYKSLKVVWYQEVQDLSNTKYIIDHEQTDNEGASARACAPVLRRCVVSVGPRPFLCATLAVSPWETRASKYHGLWKTKFPKLAPASDKPGAWLSRKPKATLRFEPEPESMALGDSEVAADVREVCLRVLKRLFSNEATHIFQDPVPQSEEAYYARIERPICLSEIAKSLEDGG